MIRKDQFEAFQAGVAQWVMVWLLLRVSQTFLLPNKDEQLEQQVASDPLLLQSFLPLVAALAVVPWKKENNTNKDKVSERPRHSKHLETNTPGKKLQLESMSTPTRNIPASLSLSSGMVELPSDVLVAICQYLHPRDVAVSLSCVNTEFHALFSHNHHDLWKALWYRDYGNVLLQWKLGRRILEDSLSHHIGLNRNENMETTTKTLEAFLSRHLDCFPQQFQTSLKNFYFIFGETYLNFLLSPSERNAQPSSKSSKFGESNALYYMGLHGHIVNFTQFAPYHPGLIEPVLEACGRDATDAFEDLSHSKGARTIAALLVEVVHQGCLHLPSQSDHESAWGLILCEPPPHTELQKMLELSNSRPLAVWKQYSRRLTYFGSILPTKPYSKQRSLPTLQRIRDAYGRDSTEHSRPSPWYFDPLRMTWSRPSFQARSSNERRSPSTTKQS